MFLYIIESELMLFCKIADGIPDPVIHIIHQVTFKNIYHFVKYSRHMKTQRILLDNSIG